MVTFVYGGSGSGKSEYAESLILKATPQKRLYIATMAVWDDEGRRRVERHREMRRDKGFDTLECTHGLLEQSIPTGCAALLEDLTNLFMGEWYEVGAKGAVDRVLQGVDRLLSTAETTVIVGNDIFADGCDYSPEMTDYLNELSRLHREIARRADHVTEVVCAIPISHR